MAAPESNDASDIFWPGYVDAISNLAINLLFVVAVMTIVVIGATLQINELLKRKDRALADDVSFSAMATNKTLKGSSASEPKSNTSAESQGLKANSAGNTDTIKESANAGEGKKKSSAGAENVRTPVKEPKTGVQTSGAPQTQAALQQSQLQSQQQANAQTKELLKQLGQLAQMLGKAQAQAQSQAQSLAKDKDKDKPQSQAQQAKQNQANEQIQELIKELQQMTLVLQASQAVVQQQQKDQRKDQQQQDKILVQLRSTQSQLNEAKLALGKIQAASGSSPAKLEGPPGTETETGRVETVNATQRPPAPEGKNSSLVVQRGVVVNFNVSATDLSDAEAREVVEKMATFAPVATAKWTVTVVYPKGFSEAMRLAFYRATAVRNVLLKNGVKGENIEQKVLESTQPSADNTRVIIRPGS